MNERKLQIGDTVMCIGATSKMAKLAHLKKGDHFIVTAVDRGIYTDLINVRREDEERPIWTVPLLPEKDFEFVYTNEGSTTGQ